MIIIISIFISEKSAEMVILRNQTGNSYCNLLLSELGSQGLSEFDDFVTLVSGEETDFVHRSMLSSYLSGRSQCVYIDGALSSLLDDLSWDLFSMSVFTNDAPETVHEHSADIAVGHEFNTQCTECGGICCYADDSTYSQTCK